MTGETRMHSPIPAPSEAQLDAGADRDPNAKVAPPENVQPPMSDDQRGTSTDGNAPHTQPEGTFTGSEYPVDADHPETIAPVDERVGNLDENGQPRGKSPAAKVGKAK